MNDKTFEREQAERAWELAKEIGDPEMLRKAADELLSVWKQIDPKAVELFEKLASDPLFDEEILDHVLADVYGQDYDAASSPDPLNLKEPKGN
jgi:hypothetical protein